MAKRVGLRYMQSVGGKIVPPSLYVGSEGLQGFYKQVQRVSYEPLNVEVARRDLPDWYNLIDSDERNIWDVITVPDGFTVLKLHSKTLDIEASLTIEDAAYYPWCINAESSYIYVGGNTGKIYKFTKTPLAHVGTLVVHDDGIINGMKIYGNYLYCVGFDGLGWIGDRVWKVYLPTLTLVGTVNVPATWNAYTSYLPRPQIYGNYLYYTIATVYTMATKVVKIEISPTFQYNSMLTLDAGDRVASSLQLYGTTKLILNCGGGGGNPAKIVKVDIATFTREASIDLPSGDGVPHDGVIAPNNRYYCLTYDKIVEIDLDSWERTGDTVDIDSEGGYYPICIVVMP